jgi:NTP pyrophosphatase (non-canonical NTP hydrolase)
MNLKEFSKLNRARSAKYFPQCEEWSVADWTMALTGELGELCNFLKKRKRGTKVKDEDIAKELADIFCYLDLLAGKLGVDLSEIVPKKFNEVSDRVKSDIKL